MRVDFSDISRRCYRTDHNQSRLVNNRREEAHQKHGEQSIESVPAFDPRWLPILMEEVGEVAHALTYDAAQSPAELADELLDVMAVCGAWLDALRVEDVHPRTSAWLA